MDAYKVASDVYRTGVDAEGIRVKTLADLERLEIEVFDSEVKKYGVDVDAYNQYNEALVRKYLGDIQAYEAEGRNQGLNIDGHIRSFLAKIDQAKAKVANAMERARIATETYKHSSSARIEAIKGVSSVIAQTVAGMWSSAHATASIGYQGSEQLSNSASCSVDYNYSCDTTE